MRSLIILFATALICTTLSAQDLASVTNYADQEEARPAVKLPKNRKANFPGGANARSVFFNDNLVYPQSATSQYVEGLVVVEFTVGRNGAIQSVEVVQSLTPDCDQEAIRLVRAMPNWTPAVRQGRLKAARIRMPILFQMR